MHPAAFFRELQKALPRGRSVLVGRRRLRALGPRDAAGAAGAAAGCGSVRWAPSARRCRTAWRCSWRIRGGRVAVITGDGALGFYIAEMDSAGAAQAADGA